MDKEKFDVYFSVYQEREPKFQDSRRLLNHEMTREEAFELMNKISDLITRERNLK